MTTLNAKDFATQTTLAQILAKIISAPSTEAKQISLEAKIDIIDAVLDTLVAKDFATQTTLATLLTQSGYEAKADIALTVLRDAILGSSSKTLTDIVTILAGILTAKIDQTTDGTTNRVVAKISQTAGENLVQLSGSNFTELASDVNIITTKWKQAQEYDIYGVKWDKSANPTLIRTDDAIGLTANAGVGYDSVTNDFDKLPIFGEIEQVEDSLGNVFMKVPKFYCRDTDGTSHKQMQVSKRRYSGFYLPYIFWDFTNKKELPYALIGKHKASLGAGDKLESKPNQYPLTGKNIV